MSKISLAPNASGTGTLTIAAPNTSTDRTLTLPDATGTVQVSGQPVSATTGTFSGTVSGGSTIGVGGATPSASGAGITFPATQSASSDANTLDDYEEGTWTPVLTRSGGSVSVTYDGAYGHYIKIGRLVTARAFVRITAVASQSGTYNTVTGLPFASGGVSSAYEQVGVVGYNDIMNTVDPNFARACFVNGSTVQFYGGKTSTEITVNWQAGYLGFTISYETAN